MSKQNSKTNTKQGKTNTYKWTPPKKQNGVKPKKVKVIDKTKPIYDRDKKPKYIVQVPTQQMNYKTNVVVTANWNDKAVLEMQAALTSYFLARSIAGSTTGIQDLQTLYNGMLYQWQGFCNDVAGLPNLTTRLQVIHDLISGFSQKDVVKHVFQKVSYGWKNIQAPGAGQYNTGWNTWDFVLPLPDDGTYISPAIVFNPVPSPEAYSDYLTLVKAISSDRAHYLRCVVSEEQSPLGVDVSAFAKVYPYCGLNPSGSGGFYNDVENEVDIRAPILSHNVVYPPTQDDRVPMKLTVNEGGPAAALSVLVPGYDNWYNKCHIQYKFIDFFEVVNELIYFYLAAVRAAVEDTDRPLADYALPFTLQDFTIVVRQSLMCFFREQFLGQFVGPLDYDSGRTNYLPFQILGNCYGNDTFKNLIVPILLGENMSMLQTVKEIQTSRKSKINNVVYVPVWGYYNDVQPIWQIPSPTTPVDLFLPATQKVISLVDCTTNGSVYINVNSSYYANVFDTWNDRLQALKKYINVVDMANLTPPQSAAFLKMTRVNGYIPQDQQKRMLDGSTKVLPFPCLKPISNAYGSRSIKDTDNKKKTAPSLPPPTDVTNITIEEIYANAPVQKEIHELMTYLVIPSIRLDEFSANDLLNKLMYQTITGEGLSQTENTLSTAPGYLSRQKNAADMCVDGQGKITSSMISITMQKLISEGRGGFLSGLLGGIAKGLVPSASGVIDSIASAMPF